MLKPTEEILHDDHDYYELRKWKCECGQAYWFSSDSRISYYELMHVLCNGDEVDIVTGAIVEP